MSRLIGWLAVAGLMFSGPALAGQLWVVNKSGDSVHVLDLAHGQRLAELPTGAGPHEVAVSADGRLAVVGDYGGRDAPGNTLQVYDARAKKPLREIDLGEHSRPHGLAFLPDDRRVAVTTEGSGHLLVVDLEEGEIEAAIATEARISHMVALSPDGRRAYVPNIGSDSLSVVDLETESLIRNLPTGAQAEGVAVSPDGAEIWVSNRGDDTLSVIDAETLEIVATVKSGEFPIRAVISGDGERVFVTNARSAELAVFDRAERRKIARLDLARGLGAEFADTLLGRGPLPIGVAVHGDFAYVALAGGDHIAVIDTRRWEITDRWATGREPDGLAIVAD